MKYSKYAPRFDWTAVRDGDLYCSPACGGRCTFAAFEAATREADELVRQLGPKWTAQVWENLGWHYVAEVAGLRVDALPEGFQPGMHFSAVFGGHIASGATPIEAVRAVLTLATVDLRKLRMALGFTGELTGAPDLIAGDITHESSGS